VHRGDAGIDPANTYDFRGCEVILRASSDVPKSPAMAVVPQNSAAERGRVFTFIAYLQTRIQDSVRGSD
jgi:hypothetical protein